MKYNERLRLVQHACEHGNKPAAKAFGCTVKTVRKWTRRWKEDNHSRVSLQDRSRAPRTCPHKASPQAEQAIVRARQKAPCLGARRLKRDCALAPSEGAIARVLRQRGLTQRRKKKYEKKRDMREMKAKLRPFEQLQVDTKYLNDIPYYVEQMARNPELPRFEYTARCPRTGAVFLGFGRELSEALACVFAAAVLRHLGRCGHRTDIVQTDNGSEYSGMERVVRHDRGFTHVVRDLFKATHRFIPPGKKNHQADVESLHERIEAEFLDLERFASRKEFFTKASAWQLWWNSTRKNGYKGDRTPHQILLEHDANAAAKVWFLPALDLDALMNARAQRSLDDEDNQRGYYLPALPEGRAKGGRRAGGAGGRREGRFTNPCPQIFADCHRCRLGRL